MEAYLMSSNRKSFTLAGISLAVLFVVVVLTMAPPTLAQRLFQESPGANTAFTYQGRLTRGRAPVTEACNARFKLFDAETGGHQIGSTQTATIHPQGGLFTVQLDFGDSPFDGNARWLDIAVQCPGDASWVALGRTPITAAPYALYALKAAKTEGYANVVTVAKSGGDYTSIQAAIDTLDENTLCDNPVLVWVAPGTYTETVTLKPCMTLAGAGKELTRIVSHGSSSFPRATVTGSWGTTVRNLGISSTGDAPYTVALAIASDPNRGLPPVTLENLSIKANNQQETGIKAVGIHLRDASLNLNDVDIQVMGGSNIDAIGLMVSNGIVHGRQLDVNARAHKGLAHGIDGSGAPEFDIVGGEIIVDSWQDKANAAAVALTGSMWGRFADMIFTGGIGVQVDAQEGYTHMEITRVDILSAETAIQASGPEMAQLILHECTLNSNTMQTLSLDGSGISAQMRLTAISGDEQTFDLKNGAAVSCLQVHDMDLQPVNCP